MIVITNNIKVRDGFQDLEVVYVDGMMDMVLGEVRDYVHAGHRILTHPLSGSIKPSETPFKTIAITKDSGKLDVNSLMLIEEAIGVHEKFAKNTLSGKRWAVLWQKYREQDLLEREAQIVEDFREIDYTLFANVRKCMEN